MKDHKKETSSLRDLAKALAALDPWERAARNNWALVPQTSAEPFLVVPTFERKDGGPVAGRLLFFPGFETFRDFLLARQVRDYGVAMSAADFRHYEVVGLTRGGAEIFVYEPGFVPQPPTPEDEAVLLPLVRESYGLLLRQEENPELLHAYVASDHAMFARKEVVDGVWVDGPFRLPAEEPAPAVERIGLKRETCAKAKDLPVFPKETWQVDFVLVPSYQTADARPRFLYLFVAINAATGERMAWARLSVDGKEGGLLRLWEGHAQRLLDAIVSWGRVPGEIHVRSGRMMRFLRPLGMQLPFKLVRHEKLPALDATVRESVKARRI